ncbi:low molecular weight protein tyrosine phosphatase family protein [Halomonas sp. G11]|uniref:low molecular weight protein tyrosine phosphatase family protein n=1 Tax=Halomonas sp. G11 TaxID=1684425 RepID=UPI0007FE8BE4|nr:phosphotyrosine protein phosphatase [Halomonas sp. G11]OAZ98694.1 phosphotyrosine protein phosphatase [Halomonas sp. G11]
MNLLFICSENRLRSPTAESVFAAYPGIKAIGAGTGVNAQTPVSRDLIEWANIVLVMEKHHQDEVARTYRDVLKDKPLVCLDIPDHYEFMEPELITLLKERVTEYVRLSSGKI